MSAFTCPRCGMSSAHPKDIEQGYCGACHDWTGVDGMDVLRHWLAIWPTDEPGAPSSRPLVLWERDLDEYREKGWRIEGPFPHDHEGAVWVLEQVAFSDDPRSGVEIATEWLVEHGHARDLPAGGR